MFLAAVSVCLERYGIGAELSEVIQNFWFLCCGGAKIVVR